jgi:hypothetical protein
MQKSTLTRDRKRRNRWRARSRACLSFSLTSRELFTKNSSRQAEQSIPHTTVKFYGDCVKMYEDFAPNFDDKRTGCCITTTHLLTLPFSLGNLGQKQYDCRPRQPYFSLFLRLKRKLEGRHFETIEVFEAKSQCGVKHPHRTGFSGCI